MEFFDDIVAEPFIELPTLSTLNFKARLPQPPHGKMSTQAIAQVMKDEALPQLRRCPQDPGRPSFQLGVATV